MRILRLVTLVTISIGLGVSGAIGGTIVAAAAANLSHSYKSTQNITPGSLVILDTKQTGYVEEANSGDNQNLLGVSVSSDGSLLAVNSTPSDTQVALSGIVSALVSTINGPISTGDSISTSPINGVGMKAQAGSQIIGIAQQGFSTSSAGAQPTQITDKSGSTSTVAVGYIPIIIAISTSPNLNNLGSSTVQKLANEITGHTVSTLPLTVSAIIAFIAIVSVIALVYGTIRGSMISIGRNPLAKPAIFESLAQVIGMAVLIVIISLIMIYFVLH